MSSPILNVEGFIPGVKEGRHHSSLLLLFCWFYFALADLLLFPHSAWGMGKWTVLRPRRWSGAFVLRPRFWLHLTGLKSDSHRAYSHLIFFPQWWLRQECSKSRHLDSVSILLSMITKSKFIFSPLKSAPGGVLPSIFFILANTASFLLKAKSEGSWLRLSWFRNNHI